LFLSLHPWHNAKNQLHHHVLGGKKKVFKCKQAPEKANPLCIQADKPFREKRISLCVCNSNGMLFSSSPISNSVVHIYWTAVCTRLLYFVKVEYKTCIQVAPPACCLFCRKKRQETRRHGCCNEQKRGKTKSPQERCQERNQKRNQTQRLCVCVCVCVCVGWGGNSRKQRRQAPLVEIWGKFSRIPISVQTLGQRRDSLTSRRTKKVPSKPRYHNFLLPTLF
jgi:hypothetical protein